MTIIVAVKDGKNVYMGADSQVTAGTKKYTLPEASSKTFMVGDVLVGFAGSITTLNYIIHELELPKREKEQDLNAWMALDVSNAVFNLLSKYRQVRNIDNIPSMESEMLMAVNGKIFEFDNSFCVMEYTGEYAAVGNGANYALGSLYTTDDSGMKATDRVTTALNAATAFDATCAEPFYIMKN